MLNLAVFVSGRGSNLKAISESSLLKDLISIKAVFSDKTECKAFDFAREHSIVTYAVGNKESSLKNSELISVLTDLKIDLIVLAGYLKLIPSELIESYRDRIINIHPALLPSFGGKGMYGINVHTAVFNSSSQVSGATVHFVDQTYDTGKIIAQKCVDISDCNSPEEVASKVLEIEHKLLPEVIKAFAEKRIKIINNRVRVI